MTKRGEREREASTTIKRGEREKGPSPGARKASGREAEKGERETEKEREGGRLREKGEWETEKEREGGREIKRERRASERDTDGCAHRWTRREGASAKESARERNRKQEAHVRCETRTQQEANASDNEREGHQHTQTRTLSPPAPLHTRASELRLYPALLHTLPCPSHHTSSFGGAHTFADDLLKSQGAAARAAAAEAAAQHGGRGAGGIESIGQLEKFPAEYSRHDSFLSMQVRADAN